MCNDKSSLRNLERLKRGIKLASKATVKATFQGDAHLAMPSDGQPNAYGLWLALYISKLITT